MEERAMSESVHAKPGPALEDIHEVRARFASPEALNDAVEQLEVSGFDRADLSLPEVLPPADRATPEAGAKPADTGADARQARTLHTSGAAAAVALAAAGVVIGTGGAAAPAVAAAVIGGGLAGGAAFAISSAANGGEQSDREFKAATGTLILTVRAMTSAKRADAEAILRSAGATALDVV
jgi:hypothetical protein